MQWLRGAVLGISSILFFAGLAFLPLAEAASMTAIAPILVTVLAVRLLGERAPRGAAWALACSFTGVLLIVRPGRTWSTLGRLLDPITQDVCAFYNDHALYDDFGGVVVDLEEGARVARSLGRCKAVILQNHGLLTVGQTVDEAAWWYITMERSCQVQLSAEAASARTGAAPRLIRAESARQAFELIGTPNAGWFQFQPLFARIVKEQPDLLD